MIFRTNDNRQLFIHSLSPADHDRLFDYLQYLSAETKGRFGPHSFERDAIDRFYSDDNLNQGFIAGLEGTGEMVAYAIIRSGFLEHDRFRLESYGLTLNPFTDLTFAPSVADAWQSKGVGDGMFRYIRESFRGSGAKRMILWGGVQKDNVRAVNYYLKHGFRILGEFEYNGWNYDMILDPL